MAVKKNYVGIDVGGSKTAIKLFSNEGKVLAENKFPTSKDSGEFISNLLKAYKKIVGKKPVTCVGLALPCSIDESSGAIIACGNLPWQGVNITHELEAKLKVPVVTENDAVLGGLAEAKLGNGRDYKTVLYVTISTGVGTGIIVDGKIRPELRKTEGGMMVFATRDQSYKRLEDLVAGPDFKARFGKYGFDVIDPNIWEAFARDLAAGIFNMITLITPDVVVLGGGMSVHYDAFRKPLAKFIEQLNPGMYPTPPIKKAKHVEEAVSLGCFLLASSPKSS